VLHFLPGYAWFAIAGAVAAAGPVIIHLLNRRRFRVVPWAAMDFLKEALRRNRRILEWRDVILLFLRTLAVVLFGFALARPLVPADSLLAWRVLLPAGIAAVVCGLMAAALRDRRQVRNLWLAAMAVLLAVCAAAGLSRSGAALLDKQAAGHGQSLQAILIIDNSLSMGYKQQRTLLDEAKSRAAAFIDRLPEESRITVIPLCGASAGYTLDPYPDKEDARRALDRINLVDRQGTAARAIELALEACERTSDSPPGARRIVFFGDQQRINWPFESLEDSIKRLPELQVVDVSSSGTSNAWVSAVEVQDGLADAATPATIRAKVRYEGPQPRHNVQVTLMVEGAEVATRTIDRLEPGPGETEISFKHLFAVDLQPGQVRNVPVKVSLSGDQLAGDDTRHLSVPVVAALPVVFVDQYGAEGEEISKGRIGETGPFRWMLAPKLAGEPQVRPLIQVRHTTIDRLDRKLLADARLVVIAGVADPGGATLLLRQFVEQGGRLILAAGGDFNPVDWTKNAWLDGLGILPAPLTDFVGKSLAEDPRAEPFHIDFASLANVSGDFHLVDESPQGQHDVYGSALFFKAVGVDQSPKAVRVVIEAEQKRLEAERGAVAGSDEQLRQWQEKELAGTLTEADRLALGREIERRNELKPGWLLWKNSTAMPPRDAPAVAPRVLASFTNGAPFLVERKIGDGEVLFMTSSIYSSWNTLPTSHAVFLLDRLVRRRIERTLPVRNVGTVTGLPLPIDANDGRARFVLTQPDGRRQDLTYDALGGDAFGLILDDLSQRGVYKIEAFDSQSPETGEPRMRWPAPMVLAANGPTIESQLGSIGRPALEQKLAALTNFRWVGPTDEISVEGASAVGQRLWWWLAAVLIACLVAEMFILAWPALRTNRGPVA
jgi:hypothetical protein